MSKKFMYVPKHIFDIDGAYNELGTIGVSVIVGLCRRMNPQLQTSTVSLRLLYEDVGFNYRDNRMRKKYLQTLQYLQDTHQIQINLEEDIKTISINQAFDVFIYYDLIPFIKLYAHELEAIRNYDGRPAMKLRMLTVFLYIVSHINDKTKHATFVAKSTIASDLQFDDRTLSNYLHILSDDIGILYKQGYKRTEDGFIIQLWNRNIEEYIWQHRIAFKNDKTIFELPNE